MSDTTDSLLTSAPILPDPLQLDASEVDQNLRSIRQVEASWRLPVLPDEVRLDLASQPGLKGSNLARFLYGMDRDYHGENEEDLPQETDAPAVPALQVYGGQPLAPLAQTGFEQATNLITSLRGQKASEVLDADATQRWKLDAIEKGYLKAPDNGIVDNTWSPELASVQREMQYDNYNDVLRGNRPGAMPLTGKHGLLETLYNWTSPSGLMRHAVDLDLWWDAGAIGKEISSWGDKWRKVGKSSGLFDFSKNLFDALTGPIDDIAVPALNMALLVSGIGAGTNFARLGLMAGVDTARAVEGINALYRVPKALPIVGRIFPMLGGAGEAAGAVKGLSEASWLSQRLSKGAEAAVAAGEALNTRQTVGGAMAAWRELPGVIAAKRGVQTGMRLGFASQAEDLLPGYQGGHSLGEVPGVRAAMDSVLAPTNATGMVVQGLGEVLLAPYTIFEPGTFVNGGRDAVTKAFRFLGTAPGRATAGAIAGAGVSALSGGDAGDTLTDMAVGAGIGAALPGAGHVLHGLTSPIEKLPLLKAVPKLGNFLTKVTWQTIGEDQRLTAIFQRAMDLHLDDEARTAFNESAREKGFLKAFADYHGIDEEASGAAMAYVLTSAAIDRTAAIQAGDGVIDQAWHQQQRLFRNKLNAQLRVFDEDTTLEQLVWNMAVSQDPARRGLNRRYKTLLGEIRSDDNAIVNVAEMVGIHNEQAAQTMRQLLSPENLPVNGLDQKMAEYIAGTMDTFGNWSSYSPASGSLRDLLAGGLFEEAQYVAPKSIFGRKLSQLEHLDEFLPLIDDGKISKFSTHMDDHLIGMEGTTMLKARRSGLYYNPLARVLDGTGSRFSIGKVGKAWKHEYIEAADELQQIENLMTDWLRVSKMTTGDGAKVVDAVDIGTLTSHQMTQTIQALAIKTTGKQDQSLRRLNRIVRQMNKDGRQIKVDQAFEKAVTGLADEIGSDAKWAKRYEIADHVYGEDGRALTGMERLAQRRKDLYTKARSTASKVDHEALVESVRASRGDKAAQDLADYFSHIESQGYTVVHGADFLMPEQLLHDSGMFADINARHMNAMTLGNFFGRHQPEALRLNVQRARYNSISKELGLAVDDPKVAQAMHDLWQFGLLPELEKNASMADDIAHMNWLRKRGVAIANTGVAKSIQDLGLGTQQNRVLSVLTKAGWSDNEALAIWRGVKQGRYAEFKDLGLYAIEAKLRKNSQLVQGLHVLGGTPQAEAWKRAVPGVLAGGAVGMVTAQSTLPEGASVGDQREAKILGGLVGGVAGGLARVGAGALTNRAEAALNTVEHARLARYGYLADNMAAMRDRLRFSLSPFFDISRFTEAYMLSNTGAPKRLASGERIAIPVNQSPRALRKAFEKEELAKLGTAATEDLGRITARNAADRRFTQVMNEFQAASRGHFDPQLLESSGKWFQDIGIMGFNPTAWMSSSFHHLRQQGLSPEAAYEAVRDAYTYGTRGRSAAEQSVNFLFFPFSFQKQVATHAAQWLADDMVRSVLIHDAYKAYEILNERYDLGQWVEEHVPVLEKLQQLNAFAFGLSPGRLGGINAPWIDAMIGNPMDPHKSGIIFNLFNPQGAALQDKSNVDMLKQAVYRSIPAINDLNHMIEDTKDQGHVLFSNSHVTRAAEVGRGYDEWGEFRQGMDAALKNVGASWYDLYNNPGLGRLKDLYLSKKVELEDKYPAWVESKLKSQNLAASLQIEKEHRLNTVLYHPEEATPSDVAFYKFESQLEAFKEYLGHFGVTAWEDMSPEDFTRVKGVAIEMARSTPGFDMIWNKFYKNTFGNITSPRF